MVSACTSVTEERNYGTAIISHYKGTGEWWGETSASSSPQGFVTSRVECGQYSHLPMRAPTNKLPPSTPHFRECVIENNNNSSNFHVLLIKEIPQLCLWVWRGGEWVYTACACDEERSQRKVFSTPNSVASYTSPCSIHSFVVPFCTSTRGILCFYITPTLPPPSHSALAWKLIVRSCTHTVREIWNYFAHYAKRSSSSSTELIIIIIITGRGRNPTQLNHLVI